MEPGRPAQDRGPRRIWAVFSADLLADRCLDRAGVRHEIPTSGCALNRSARFEEFENRTSVHVRGYLPNAAGERNHRQPGDHRRRPVAVWNRTERDLSISDTIPQAYRLANRVL